MEHLARQIRRSAQKRSKQLFLRNFQAFRLVIFYYYNLLYNLDEKINGL